MRSYLPAAATLSKDPRAWGETFQLKELSRANGAYVFDPEGNRYIDWVSGLGAVLLGHSYPVWLEAVSETLQRGVAFPLPHLLERRAAEMLTEHVGRFIWPDAERIGFRFGKNGSDVTTAAVRLARAVTGRELILKPRGSYHGWSDWAISTTEPARGITHPQYVAEFEYGDLSSLTKAREDADNAPLAAVILEPPLEDLEPPFYQGLRALCDRQGALLIMDEICTAVRFAAGGVCQEQRIDPDLVCMGKPLGNGLPVSALMGSHALMREFDYGNPVFVSGTHLGEALGLSALCATLEIARRRNIRSRIKTIGGYLMGQMKRAIREHGLEEQISIRGRSERSLLIFADNRIRGFFISEMSKRGVLMNRPNYPSFSHQALHVRKSIRAAHEVLKILADLEISDLPPGPVPLFEGR